MYALNPEGEIVHNHVEEIKEYLDRKLFSEGSLDESVSIRMVGYHERFLRAMVTHYRAAHSRGDWFGSHFKQDGNLILSDDVLERDARLPSSLWVLFVDDSDNLLGTTKLMLQSGNRVLIDETQVDPNRGRGKGIMPRYFRKVVPILEAGGLHYWTEFVLTRESRVLRKSLIDELRMVVTGLRPVCYERPSGLSPQSVLTAHGPHSYVRKALEMLRNQEPLLAGFFSLLGYVPGSQESGILTPRMVPNSASYTEVIHKVTDSVGIRSALDVGMIPVGIDPLLEQVTLAEFPRCYPLALKFVMEENSDAARRLVEYMLRITEGG
jgi:hypothetical protein